MAKEWVAVCKDCNKPFGYSNASFQADITRGFSAPERCPVCRGRHSKEVRSVGLSHFQLKPIGNLPPGLILPPGRLGKIYHDLPPHRLTTLISSFEKYRFGITELDILRVFASLGARFEITPRIQTLLIEESTQMSETEVRKNSDIEFRNNQVVVVEGPTGSGKSTLLPYRLMAPPQEITDPLFFTRRGQIVITQPRVQATRGIPKFVAEQLHGSSLGPGFDVGFKHHNAAETDRRNLLVFVTDGTLINWIINEQLGNLSLIMIDEAHERSLNIDLILGLLKARLPRYPNLKLIIASATIAAQEFITYFGGSERVGHLVFRGISKPVEEHFSPKPILDYEGLHKKSAQAIDIVASKAVSDRVLELLEEIIKEGPTREGDILAFLHSENSIDLAHDQIKESIQKNRKFISTEVFRLYRSLHQTEQDKVLMNKAKVIGNKIIDLMRRNVKGKGKAARSMLALVLDERTARDIADLLRDTGKNDNKYGLEELTIEIAHEEMSKTDLGKLKKHLIMNNQAYLLIATYKAHAKINFTVPQVQIIEDRRVIISTNVAETSLTVDGVVYVIDSGIIKQTTWDPKTLTQRLVSKAHSKAGCRQRRGRAGRIRAGHAYYLYTEDQFAKFEEHTQPEIKRAPLEAVVLSAKAAGVDDIAKFDWFQRTPEMDAELQRSRSALVVRHILDPDGDITEQGLELRSLALDIQTANFLKNADRFSCALEAATLIPILLMKQSLLGGLFLWDPNWDASTRWEVKKRQYGLRGECEDDLALCMKVFAGWESAGKDDHSQEVWARNFMVNHQMLSNYILPERSALLDRLAIATKGEALRPIDFDLLDRLRIVFAYSYPDQLGSSEQYTIDSESICFGQQLPAVVFGRRIPFRTAIEGQPDFRVSLILRLDPNWGNLGQLAPLQLGRLISRVTRSNKGEELYRSPIWDQLSLLKAPIGAKFNCKITAEKSNHVNLTKMIKTPNDVYRRPKGIYILEEEAEEELEVDGAVRSQGKWSRYINYESPEEELEQELRIEDNSKIRVICLPTPDTLNNVDIYLDDELGLTELSLSKQTTAYFEVAPGNHKLAIVPFGQTVNVSPIATLSLEELRSEAEYSIILEPWNSKKLMHGRVFEDHHQVLTRNGAELRWIPAGRIEKVNVYLNGHFSPIGKYRLIDNRRPVLLEIYKHEGKEKGEEPLLKDKLAIMNGESNSLLLFSENGSKKIQYSIISEIDVKRPGVMRSEDSSLPLVAQLPDWFSSPSKLNSLDAIIDSYDFGGDHSSIIRILPNSLFDKFSKMYKKDQTIEICPYITESYPERSRASLIVTELTTHLEIAVDGDEVLFSDYQSENALEELRKFQRISFMIDNIDNAHERIYLTRLPLLDAELSKWVDNEKKISGVGVVVDVILQGPRLGLIIVFDLGGIPGLSVLVRADRVVQSSLKPLGEYHIGEQVKAQLNFTGGKVRGAGWSEEMQENVSNRMPKEMTIQNDGGEFVLRIERPMRYFELEKLINLHSSRIYKEAMRALYRSSNLPQIDLIDPQRIAMIDKRYPLGVIVESCIIKRIIKDNVELIIEEPNILGSIHISEWSNTFIDDLDKVAKTGDVVAAKVLRREDNGFLRLSRKHAALIAYQVNARYRSVVQTVDDNGAEILLIKTENGQVIQQPLSGYAQKFQLKFVPKDSPDEFHPEQFLKPGQEVICRILSIDQENGRILLTLWRFYEVTLDVLAQTKVGWYFQEHQKNRIELERTTETQIVIDKELNQTGKITLYSATLSNIQRAVSSLKQNLSGLQERRQIIIPAPQPPKVRPKLVSAPVIRRVRLPQVAREEPKGCLTALWDWIKGKLRL
ncbi:MAG: DEAD/DEAH box helicase [Chloroflexota bacterium]